MLNHWEINYDFITRGYCKTTSYELDEIHEDDSVTEDNYSKFFFKLFFTNDGYLDSIRWKKYANTTVLLDRIFDGEINLIRDPVMELNVDNCLYTIEKDELIDTIDLNTHKLNLIKFSSSKYPLPKLNLSGKLIEK